MVGCRYFDLSYLAIHIMSVYFISNLQHSAVHYGIFSILL